MKVGDLVYDRMEKRKGIITKEGFVTDIGTPFDWEIYWFDGTYGGSDTRYLEVESIEPLSLKDEDSKNKRTILTATIR